MIFRYAGTGKLAIADHKRASRDYNYSMLRNQFMLYATALETDTVIVNKVGFQKSKKPAERFLRQSFVYHPEILEEWKRDTIYRAKEMLVAQQTNYYKRNRTSCEKFNGCFLQKYCMTRPEAREFLVGTEYIVGESWDVTKVLED